ncbi:MAG: VOC family protein [Anaerolineae bacterium]|nr:VOC family protein [Anaerolineae bacterium]
MKIESFDHIHIYSKDPEEAAKFYMRFFGSEKLYQKKGAGGVRIFLSLGGQIIAIGPISSDRKISNSVDLDENHRGHQIGLDHFGIRVKDLDAAVKELRERGVQILAEPVSGSTGISYAFIAAPDGVIIEITQYGILSKMFLKYKNVI